MPWPLFTEVVLVDKPNSRPAGLVTLLPDTGLDAEENAVVVDVIVSVLVVVLVTRLVTVEVVWGKVVE